MSKNKSPKILVDFDMGFDMIVPSTQEAFKESFTGSIRKEEKSSISIFKQKLHSRVEKDLKAAKQFPSEKEIFIFIVQYFISEKDYRSRDIDNMSKTVLDALCGKFYKDDGQVKILLVTKKMEKRVPQTLPI